jgi:hypothetical protein
VHAGKVRSVAGDKGKPMLQGGPCDEGVRHVQTDLPPDAAGSLGHRSINADLSERGQQL